MNFYNEAFRHQGCFQLDTATNHKRKEHDSEPMNDVDLETVV